MRLLATRDFFVRLGIACLLCALLLAAGCAAPVGVRRVDARSVHRSLTANILSTGEPSAPSIQTLNRSNLFDRFRDDPAGALAELRARYLADPQPVDLFALAELSFVHAERGGGRPFYLASAVYAYGFLFPGRGKPVPDPFDPRLRLAADLYNRGLTAGLASEDGSVVDLSPRTLPLSFGELVLDSDPSSFLWVNHRLVDFVPVAELEVRGLRDRYRQAGIGAPLAARIGDLDTARGELIHERWLAPTMRVASTAFVRIERVGKGIAEGRVRGSVELFVAGADPTVKIDGRAIPLEHEPTAAMAYSLTKSRLWELEIPGFMGEEVDLAAASNLVMLQPHRKGRIPVVFVHGTASSPVRWAEMVNELRADPRLRAHYEAWIFFYRSGNPILYSALQLREAIGGAIAALDPDGRDPGLQRVVMIGHSQGGLLTKLMVVQGGERFWSNVSDVSIEELDLESETEALLESAFYFEPLPQVRRVIFICTPHGGSFLAGRRLGSFASSLVKMPVTLGRAGRDLFETDPEKRVLRKLDHMPSSIDNMTPGNPMLVTLHDTPLDERVTGHSIIAVRTEGPPMNQHDGVVAYSSAHIEGVASEKIVISGHSAQGHPDTIAEVRRILLEHLDAR